MKQKKSKGNILKNCTSQVVQSVILLVIGIMTGYLMLMVVYLLPVGKMQENLSKSIDILTVEQEYHRVIPGYNSTQLDNYTDSWMIGNAVYDNDLPIWKRALTCTSADYGDGPLNGLVHYLEEPDGYKEVEYTRYWHGYLIILKPLLLFFSYADLRVLNMILDILLMFLIFNTLKDMGFKREAWGYIVAVLFIMPVVIPLSIQFSVMFYLTNIALWILLKKYDQLVNKNGMILYFQMIGMATSYFDFLTYPTVSLGVPMVCLLILDSNSALWLKIKKIVYLSISWGFGYSAMWAGKWVLSTLILRDNVIANALSQVLLRSSHLQNGEKITTIDTWIRNLEFYFEKPYLILIVICFIVAIVGVFRNRKSIISVIVDVFPFLLIAAMPFAWYAFAGQHSYEHHWFTFRGLLTSVFACMCICARLYKVTRNVESSLDL
jgi:hypothetical protein